MEGERGIVCAGRGLNRMTVWKGGDEIRKDWVFFVSQCEVCVHHPGMIRARFRSPQDSFLAMMLNRESEVNYANEH